MSEKKSSSSIRKSSSSSSSLKSSTNIDDSGSASSTNDKKISAKKLGAYLLINHLIGRGSFAEVYEGYRTRDNFPVAIKVISRERLNPRTIQLLDKEIQLMKHVNHLNIVRLLDVHKSRRHYYLVLERCFGPNLATFLKNHQENHRVPEHLAHKFLSDIAYGLKVMQSMNLAHRDLKPANLLLSRPITGNHVGVLKIADFGFVRQIQPNDLAETLCGSPLYMAPEIIECKKYDPAKADLWSVGVIMYEMLYGVTPYVASNILELLRRIKNTSVKYEHDDSISNHAVQFLKGLLQPDPELRMSFEEFFAHPYLNLKGQSHYAERSQSILAATLPSTSESPITEIVSTKERVRRSNRSSTKEPKASKSTVGAENAKEEAKDVNVIDLQPKSETDLSVVSADVYSVAINQSTINNNNTEEIHSVMPTLNDLVTHDYVPLDKKLKHEGALIYPDCVFDFSNVDCEDEIQAHVNTIENGMRQSWTISEAAYFFELGFRATEAIALYCKSLELLYSQYEKLQAIRKEHKLSRRLYIMSDWIDKQLNDLFERIQHVESTIATSASHSTNSTNSCSDDVSVSSNSMSGSALGIFDSHVCAEQILYRYGLRLAKESIQLEFLAKDDKSVPFVENEELKKCLAMYRRSKLIFEYLLEHCEYIKDDSDRFFLDHSVKKFNSRIIGLTTKSAA